MADEPNDVMDVLERIEQIARCNGQVTLGAVVEALGHRSHGPFLLIPALIDISPVGSIPGLPTMLALMIVIVAVQIFVGRRHLWLPGFLARRSLAAEKACKATARLRRPAEFLDRHFHGRLPMFTHGVFVRVAAALCICLALAVPPLELLPLATTAPMAAIAAFGLALLVRDGLLMLVASGLALGALGFGLSVVFSGQAA